ncbi:uncharacterized protein LOC131080117 [Cryptomeria japonica]|uniref:uncharacterized protein LOC131080117 n=1 Tax=Cryptomeria japonica TaxID=3369 RepID=UPI0025AC7731|nr:uncharacterized protein LOC131080117 [Cryptomeria japonica]
MHRSNLPDGNQRASTFSPPNLGLEKSSSPKKISGRKEQQNSSRDCIVKISFPLPRGEELQSVFNKFDANGDGKISPLELAHVMRLRGTDVLILASKRQYKLTNMSHVLHYRLRLTNTLLSRCTKSLF